VNRCSRADFTRLAPRRPFRRRLGSTRARPPGWQACALPHRVDQDASGRLMQPTFSKTSTHALCSQRCAPAAKPRATAGPAFQRRRAHLLPAGPTGPAERYRLARASEGWFLTPRHRLGPNRAREALDPAQAIEIVLAPPNREERWSPDPRSLPSAGSSVGPSADPPRFSRGASASDVPSPVARYRFGLARPSHFQPQPNVVMPNRRRLPTSATVREHEHTA
jgi:hypothetical protein